jgi:hypothetical protein
VDIVSIPWHFLAVKYDQLDQIFLPLLASAQQANDILGVRGGGPESAANAAAHLAGELLRDVSFTPVRLLSVNAANAYLIDFEENSFQVETSVSARDDKRASLFRVKVAGAIRGEPTSRGRIPPCLPEILPRWSTGWWTWFSAYLSARIPSPSGFINNPTCCPWSQKSHHERNRHEPASGRAWQHYQPGGEHRAASNGE